MLCVGSSVLLPGTVLGCRGLLVPSSQGAGAGTWGLKQTRCRRGVCAGWLCPRAGRAPLQTWEEAAPVPVTLETDPASWGCFDLEHCWSL